MQCNTFDYSPQTVFKNYASPPDQAMDVVSSTAKSCSEDLMLEEHIMKCPICAVITTTRLQFSEHLAMHCTNKRDGPEFMMKVLEQLMKPELQQPGTSSSPTQGKRPEHEHEETEEPGLRVPRVNSQGKVKLHRCKQCGHEATTKMEFWEHSRIHIPIEKRLICPKCPFVTEYKHHLEYHLRNHFGSKPFKCDLCSYTCVNKSMLNSHLKSHSNVYQYRCADCSYATKYCHSLKLHLRKYTHQPAMVLNADGSPNPLPIIDVYGTRRGPKQKPTKPKQQKQEFGQTSTVATNTIWQGVSTSPMVDNLPNTSMNGITGIINTINTTTNGMNPINGMSAINAINAISSMNSMNPIGGLNVINPIGGMNGIKSIAGLNGIKPIGGLNGINSIGGLNGVVTNRQMISYQYNKLYSQFPPAQFSTSAENQLGQLKPAALVDYAKSTGNEELPQNLIIKCKEVSTANGMLYSPSEQTEVLNLEVKTVPLDLSKSSIFSRAQNKPAPAIAVRATGTSRRKGKAVKLDRRMIEEDTDEEQQLRSPQLMQTVQQTRQGPSNSEPSSSSGPSYSGSSSNGAGCSGASFSGATSNGATSNGASFNGATSNGASSSGSRSSGPSSSGATENGDNDPEDPTDYYCKYCEIGFANIVMYTAHMEYHDLSDPHTCKMCGLKCPEKVSFFMHIARSKHT
ncbi:hunchback [Lasioglossum baleicum]|uniref:hunchback n=1 Tax=Lasioglossum baleicum TaxID=434251 RepID=UPI003FCC5016